MQYLVRDGFLLNYTFFVFAVSLLFAACWRLYSWFHDLFVTWNIGFLMRLHNLRNLEYNCYKCRSVRFIFEYLKVAIVKIVLDCMVVTQTYIILSRFQSFLNCHAKLYLLLKTSFHVSYEEKMTDSFLQYHYTKRKI